MPEPRPALLNLLRYNRCRSQHMGALGTCFAAQALIVLNRCATALLPALPHRPTEIRAGAWSGIYLCRSTKQ